jgi:hypothetical protein
MGPTPRQTGGLTISHKFILTSKFDILGIYINDLLGREVCLINI